jgi:hypothetical protein
MITPGISVRVGCLPILKMKEIIAATGTSKKTIIDTTAGDTRFSVRLNIVWPNIWAPRIRARRTHHCFAAKWIISEPETKAIGRAATAHTK